MPKSLESEYSQFVEDVSKQLFEKFKEKTKRANWAKNYLAGNSVDKPIDKEKFKEKFDEALQAEDYKKFRDNVISQISLGDLYILHNVNELKSLPIESSSITAADHELAVADLRKAVGVEDKYEGVCVVGTSGDTRNIGSEDSSRMFTVHSLGKVFTGVLISDMIAQKIIPQDQLSLVGVQLDEDVMLQLPETVVKQLAKVTLHQVMLHQADLPDYLGNYLDDIKKSVEEGSKSPSLNEPQDFLRYSGDKIEENNYSNVGILIAGLAAQHHYNKKKPESERKTYNEILKEFVLRPAKLEHFSITPPKEGLFSDDNKVQRHICGSPAGGYWASASDMQKFAGHICGRMQDKSFESAVLTYGGEFYNSQNQSIEHRGELDPGDKSSAWFSVHIPSGTSCVMASNTDHSGFIGQQVSNMIASEQKRETAKLGLQKPDEKPRSFVEVMQAEKYGKIESKGGASEL
jgi:hypothetical protein